MMRAKSHRVAAGTVDEIGSIGFELQSYAFFPKNPQNPPIFMFYNIKIMASA